MILITAHAGCEDTPAASGLDIARGLSVGADAVEMDVRVHQGIPYLSHDLSDDPAQALTLEKALHTVRARANTLVNLDIKEDEAFLPALQTAIAAGMRDRVLFTGTLTDQTRGEAIRRGAWCWVNVYRQKEETARAAAERFEREAFPWRVINIDKKYMDAQLAQELRALGLRTSVWTASEDADIERLLCLGVFNITSRRPSRALEMRKAAEHESIHD